MLGCLSVSAVDHEEEGDIRHEPISKVVGMP